MNAAFHRSLLLACGIVVAAIANGAGQTSKPSLSFFVRAIGADGQPVLDLAAGDVSLKLGGIPRTIKALDLTRFAADPEPSAAAPAGSLPAPFVTNDQTGGGGREVLIAIDDLSISPGGIDTVKAALTSIVDAVSPRDRVGLLSVRAAGINLGSTLDHAAIRAAIGGLTGQRGSDDTCRAAAIVETLGNLVVATQGPTPATIAFVSSGYAGSRMGPGCAIRPEDLRAFGTTVQRANVNLYFVQVVEGNVGSLITWFDSVAGASGAEAFRITGGNPGNAARVVRETAAAYRVTLDRENSDRTGTTARLEVRVSRPNVKVHAPPALTFSTETTTAAPTPATLLRTTASYPDLRLRAAAYASQNTGGEGVKLVVAFEPSDPAATIASAAIALFDANGQSSARWTARRSDFERTPVLAGFPVPAGRYRLRVAAIDAAGRAGAVDVPIVAALAKVGPLTVSAMALGAMQDGAFVPRLQFGSEPQAAAYFEIYGASADATPSVRVELSRSAGGPALATSAASLHRSASGDALIVTAPLAIADLPPGDAVVRAVIDLDGKTAGQVTQTLRKGRP